jgi:uncharacterized protein (DUF433 family)
VTHAELLQRISIDPQVCGGKPCIRGHRIWVSLILDLLAGGMTLDAILGDYPQLTLEDLLACIAFASEMTRERTVHVARGATSETRAGREPG